MAFQIWTTSGFSLNKARVAKAILLELAANGFEIVKKGA